jgi:hypothetical protein
MKNRFQYPIDMTVLRNEDCSLFEIKLVTQEAEAHQLT